MTTPAQLRKAALAIAKDRHPDQFGSINQTAFARAKDAFATVRMSGGDVIVLRSEAENRCRIAAKTDGPH